MAERRKEREEEEHRQLQSVLRFTQRQKTLTETMLIEKVSHT